jgi:anti-sigma regulatory factor (Ser/Thr protein kinase)
MQLQARHRLPHGPSAPAAAREAVDAAFAGRIEDDALAEVILLVSEVVTNAVRHGRDDDGTVELGLALGDDSVRVEVVDAGSGFTPPRRSSDPEAPGGWGLVVVERLADRWGVEAPGSTLVWFERNV